MTMTSDHTGGQRVRSLPKFLSPRYVGRPQRNRGLIQFGLVLLITAVFVIYGAAGGSLAFWSTESVRDGAVQGLGTGVVVALLVLLVLNAIFGSMSKHQSREIAAIRDELAHSHGWRAEEPGSVDPERAEVGVPHRHEVRGCVAGHSGLFQGRPVRVETWQTRRPDHRGKHAYERREVLEVQAREPLPTVAYKSRRNFSRWDLAPRVAASYTWHPGPEGVRGVFMVTDEQAEEMRAVLRQPLARLGKDAVILAAHGARVMLSARDDFRPRTLERRLEVLIAVARALEDRAHTHPWDTSDQ